MNETRARYQARVMVREVEELVRENNRPAARLKRAVLGAARSSVRLLLNVLAPLAVGFSVGAVGGQAAAPCATCAVSGADGGVHAGP